MDPDAWSSELVRQYGVYKHNHFAPIVHPRGVPNLEKVLRNSVNKSVNWVEPRSATVLYLTLALPECIMVAAPASAYPR